MAVSSAGGALFLCARPLHGLPVSALVLLNGLLTHSTDTPRLISHSMKVVCSWYIAALQHV